MTGREANSTRRTERVIVNGLWATAGIVLVLGFALRPLARFFGGPDLRITSVYVIGAGLAIALIGWLGEKVLARKSP